MWTPVVVEAEIRAERGRPPRRAAIGRAVRPLAQQRLDEALGFAVGLGTVGPGEAVAHATARQTAANAPGAIGHRVVGQQPADADAPPPKPGQRALEKRGTGGRIVGREHLGIGQPRRVIDRDVQILPAHAPRAAPTIAVDSMPHPDDAARGV